MSCDSAQIDFTGAAFLLGSCRGILKIIYTADKDHGAKATIRRYL